MIILSHAGKQHSYQTAKALNNLGLLDTFYTSSYLTNERFQDYFKKNGNTYWVRRFIDGLPGDKVNANWRFEVKEMLLRKLQGKSPAAQKAVYARDVNFDEYVGRELRAKSEKWKRETGAEKSNSAKRTLPTAFWGFQGSSYASLQAANEIGLTSICELATAHVVAAKRILGEEAALHPEWSDSIDNLVFPADYEKRLVEEPQIAQKVVAASSFTKSTLLEVDIPENNIIYLPLGCDIKHVPYQERKEDNIEDRPLKLLYAGTVTQRKGIKYLLESLKSLQSLNIELHIIGGIQGSGQALKEYAHLIHYHAPVSQQEMFEAYADYDALVLPTIFEGFGLVIVEAMAAGLPVITTPHSIGPELIKEDQNGYVIPIRDVDAISSAIEKLRNKSSEQYLQMRKKAREAALEYSWKAFERRLNEVIIL
ncbi:glycosyltransferase family 4 protein [Labilibacter marinus]|uniref:glycosyltransferase family 4 protein n=1 Tax=Labilibacter marinus TaxID=1477105 RepID=UPI000836ED92|nr:glycosyltransferase family 4 protein [Labilibacter marinus]